MAQDRVVSEVPAPWTPDVLERPTGEPESRVYAITKVGDTIILGGTFTRVRSHDGDQVYARSHIVAFDARDGSIRQAFAPRLDGAVYSLAPGPSGDSVYVGGRFNHVGGAVSRKLALLDLDTGRAVQGFGVPAINARVRDIDRAGGRLYIGGTFDRVGGTRHSHLATLDPVTGAVQPFMGLQFTGTHNGGSSNIRKFSISPDGSRLVAIGNFATVAGMDREQIAMLDLTGSRARVDGDWRTTRFEDACKRSYDTYMRGVDFAPDGSYFVVVTTGAYRAGRICDTASRWESGDTGSDVAPTWIDYTGGDTSTSVAVTGTAVYVGGHQRWWNNPFARDSAGAGAVPRPGIAALDPANGLPLAWNPGRIPRGTGVFDILVTDRGLWIGSDTEWIGRFRYHRQRVAFFPLAGGTTPQPNATAQLPADVYLPGPYDTTGLDGDDMPYRTYDGTRAGETRMLADTGIPWRNARGAVRIDGTLWYGWSDGNLYKRTFDGDTFGPATAPDPYAASTNPGKKPTFYAEISQISGMVFGHGRLYYTLAGQPALYYRYFTPESAVVGARRFTASEGVAWADVAGMFLSSDDLYYADSRGRLHRVDFAAGRPAVGGGTVVSGPAMDGVHWGARALFLRHGGQSADGHH